MIFNHRSKRELLAHEMVFEIAVHEVSSHQTRDLERFAESSDIPRNQPTEVLSFTLRTALSAIPLVSEQGGFEAQ